MGWGKPGQCFPGLLTREVNQWILPYDSIARFSGQREQWHSRWKKDRICKSWLLCLEEHGFFLMLLKCLASRVMLSPNVFTVKICEKGTCNGVCGAHLRKELAVGRKTHELPYFHVVVQHARSIVDLECPFKGDWTVIKPPDWVVMPSDPSPQPKMFAGTQRVV